MDFYELLINQIGHDEPIFISELLSILKYEYTEEEIIIHLIELVNKDLIGKVDDEIYYIFRQNSILKKPVINMNKIIERKYIKNKDEIYGFYSGTNFENLMGLTTQTASITTIVTNKVKDVYSEVLLGKKRVFLYKSKVEVTASNYKLLQVLELLKSFELQSEVPYSKLQSSIKQYLVNEKYIEEDLVYYTQYYDNEVNRLINLMSSNKNGM